MTGLKKKFLVISAKPVSEAGVKKMSCCKKLCNYFYSTFLYSKFGA